MDEIIILFMILILVFNSFALDRSSCNLISQSSFAILFGILCGIIFLILSPSVVASNSTTKSFQDSEKSLKEISNSTSLDQYFEFHNSIFFKFLLPPIIYQGGFSIKRKVFFRNFGAILGTAVFGTIISSGFTGSMMYLLGKYQVITSLSWVEAFLFGALISAIDPVATLLCFNKLNVSPLLFNLVFGESVLNDAVSITLYETLVKRTTSESDFNLIEFINVLRDMFIMFIGSLLVSVLVTLFGAFILKRKLMSRLRQFPVYEITICLIVSLLTYFISSISSFSGIVALFFSGTMTAHYSFYTISPEAQHSFIHLIHTISFISESLVYVFLGISIVTVFSGNTEYPGEKQVTIELMDYKFIGFTMIILLISRALNTFPILALANCFRKESSRIPSKFMFVVWFAGLRGAIAFALAKNWHIHSTRRLILATTLLVVLFTTVIIGGCTSYVLKCLRLTDDNHCRSSHFNMKEDSSSIKEKNILTPRPQFQKSEHHENENNQQSESNHFHSSGNIQLKKKQEEPEEEHSFEHLWNSFDNKYLKPMFGGKGRHLIDDHILSPRSFIPNAALTTSTSV